MSAANDMKGFLSAIAEFVPRLVGAVVVLLAALLLARLLQSLVARTLDRFGLDSLFDRTGASDALWKIGYSGGPSRILGLAVFWGTMLTGVAGSLSVLGLASLENTTNQLVNISGRALVALIIMTIGIMAAGWLSEFVASESQRAGLRGSNTFRRIVFGVVLTVASLLAVGQLGLNTNLILVTVATLLATIGLIVAIALGQGLVPLSGNVAASRYVQDGLEEGDVISVNGVEGAIEELGYASISIRSEDGDLYRIPNKTLLENVVRKKA
jgi:small-conductance mechanosensitive channel